MKPLVFGNSPCARPPAPLRTPCSPTCVNSSAAMPARAQRFKWAPSDSSLQSKKTRHATPIQKEYGGSAAETRAGCGRELTSQRPPVLCAAPGRLPQRYLPAPNSDLTVSSLQEWPDSSQQAGGKGQALYQAHEQATGIFSAV
jgi:hypothetical protein